MNARWWLANLGAHWAQATVLLGAGALAAGLFRLRDPKVNRPHSGDREAIHQYW